MHQLEKLLSRRLRQAGEDLIGFVVSRNVDGSYKVRRRDTNEVVRAEADSTDSYDAGTADHMSDPSASKKALNTGCVILRRAPSSLRNASEALPIADTTSKTNATVSIIVPNPVTLRIGETKTVEIYGAGFTVAPTFSNTKVAHNSAPTVTGTRITMQVRGDVAGTASLVVGTRTFTDLFTVAEGVLWLSSSDTADPILRFGVTAGLALASVAQSKVVRTTFASSAGKMWFVAMGAVPRLYSIDKATLVLTEGTTNVTDNSAVHLSLVPVGADFFHNNGSSEYKLDTDGVNLGSVVSARNGALYDGTYVYGADTVVSKIRRFTPATMALLLGPALGDAPTGICEDGTHLYCTAKIAGKVLKILKSDMSLVTALTGLTSPEGIVYSGGSLYVGEDTASANIRKIDAATMTLTQSVSSGRKTRNVATDGLTVWTVENNQTDPHIKGFRLSDLAVVFDVVAVVGATKNYRHISYA